MSPRTPFTPAVLSLLLAAAVQAAPPPPIFTDRAAAWGLSFTYRTGQTGDLYFPEIMGGGAALFDYDGDGDLDVFVVQGHSLKAGSPDPGPAGWGRLFRNDLITPQGRNPVPHFVDVTAASGIRAAGYGMAVATGDFDNDGRIDLYLSNFGSNQLWHNNGDGTAEARLHLEAVVSARPDDAEARRRLAQALRDGGYLPEALEQYGKAVALAPADETARLGEAETLVRLGRYAEARHRLEEDLKQIPTSGLLSHALARLLAACPDKSVRDGARALALAQAVWQAQPTSAHARTVALALAELGRCEEAAQWQRTAAEQARRKGEPVPEDLPLSDSCHP